MTLEVGFTSKDFIAAIDFTRPGSCLYALLLDHSRRFLLLAFLLLLRLEISASATARWHQVAEASAAMRKYEM